MAQLRGLGLKNSIIDFSLTKIVLLTKSEGKQTTSKETSDAEPPQTKEVLNSPKSRQDWSVKASEEYYNQSYSWYSSQKGKSLWDCGWGVGSVEKAIYGMYMETSLPNRIYVQLEFYSFKMIHTKSIDENLMIS